MIVSTVSKINKFFQNQNQAESTGERESENVCIKKVNYGYYVEPIIFTLK